MDAIRILALFYGIDRVTVIWEFLRKIIYYDTIGFRFTRAFPMRMEIETNLIYSYFCFFKRCIAVKLYTAPAPENHFYYVHCSRASQC